MAFQRSNHKFLPEAPRQVAPHASDDASSALYSWTTEKCGDPVEQPENPLSLLKGLFAFHLSINEIIGIVLKAAADTERSVLCKFLTATHTDSSSHWVSFASLE